MTNVSYKKLNSQEFIKTKQELIRTLGRNPKLAEGLVTELFTEAEQIMIIKRFAAVLMYKKGHSPYRVWNTLHISPATAERIHETYEEGHYDKLIGSLEKRKAGALLALIDDLIVAQASPKARARLMERVGF